MTQFKTTLLAGGMLAFMGTHAAMAVPTLTFEVFEDGVQLVNPSSPAASSTSGQLAVQGPAPNFSQMSLTSNGVPVLASPQLSTTMQIISAQGSAFAAGSHTIEVLVTQTGITSPTGSFNAFNTLTLNNLNGSVVSSVADYIDPGNAAFAKTTKIGMLSNGGGVSNSNGTGSITTVNVGLGPFSETQDLIATFTTAGDSLQLTDQIQVTSLAPPPPPPVPEPASLALVGSALFGLGLIRRRRNRS